MRTLYVLNIIGLILFFSVVESKRLAQQKNKPALLVADKKNVKKMPVVLQEPGKSFTYLLPTSIALKFTTSLFIR